MVFFFFKLIYIVEDKRLSVLTFEKTLVRLLFFEISDSRENGYFAESVIDEKRNWVAWKIEIFTIKPVRRMFPLGHLLAGKIRKVIYALCIATVVSRFRHEHQNRKTRLSQIIYSTGEILKHVRSRRILKIVETLLIYLYVGYVQDYFIVLLDFAWIKIIMFLSKYK